MSKIETGVVLYTIERDGCLNGLYTNEHAKGTISNEIAIHKDGTQAKDWPEEITGEYTITYLENGKNTIYHGYLNIQNVGYNIYRFEWHPGNGGHFKGTGYKMRDNLIVVRYESV